MINKVIRLCCCRFTLVKWINPILKSRLLFHLTVVNYCIFKFMYYFFSIKITVLVYFIFLESGEEWAIANSECFESKSRLVVSCSSTSSSSVDDTETSFILQYLGSTLVDAPSSEEISADAIKTVISMVNVLIIYKYYYHVK